MRAGSSNLIRPAYKLAPNKIRFNSSLAASLPTLSLSLSLSLSEFALSTQDKIQGIGLSIGQYQKLIAYYANRELTQTAASLSINRDGLKTSLNKRVCHGD
jgi:hypothetical protein